jgi:hypothetical protein
MSGNEGCMQALLKPEGRKNLIEFHCHSLATHMQVTTFVSYLQVTNAEHVRF